MPDLNTNKYIIILAGGIGSRLQNEVPKQFLLLDGRPIIMHTIDAFVNSGLDLQILLVINSAFMTYWRDLCVHYNYHPPLTLVEGGAERFYSVKNALMQIPGEGIVGIHDGVRPFVTKKVICNAFEVADRLGNAIPAVPATNTIRSIDKQGNSQALDRSKILIVQNPQVFNLKQIKQAYHQDYCPLFTDDAVVAETSGFRINTIDGDQKNIKITHPADIFIAHAINDFNKVNVSPKSLYETNSYHQKSTNAHNQKVVLEDGRTALC